MVDSGIVQAPRQRMRSSEKDVVKDGGIPDFMETKSLKRSTWIFPGRLLCDI